MGRLSLIVVVGFTIAIAVVGIALQQRNVEAQKQSMARYKQAQAQNIAKSAAEIAARDLRNNPATAGTRTYDLLGGSATVSITEKTPGSRDLLAVSASGAYVDGLYNVGYDAKKPPVQPPPVTGALGVSYLSKAKFNLGKGTNIDGNNHASDGSADGSFPAIAGLSLGHPDQMPNLLYKPKDVKIKGKGSVDPDIEVQQPQPDYYDWAMALARGADVTYRSKDVKGVATLGTPANPQVTYVKGKTKFNDNTTGAGILIIDGTCKFNKRFSFVGLVFVVGDSLTNEKATMGSGSSIIGAMMVAGKKTEVKTGDVDILYSAEAANKGLGLVQSHMPQDYAYVNWKE